MAAAGAPSDTVDRRRVCKLTTAEGLSTSAAATNSLVPQSTHSRPLQGPGGALHFFNPYPTTFSFAFLEREREKHRCERSIDWLPPYALRLGIHVGAGGRMRPCNPGMRPDGESNPQCFSLGTTLQPLSLWPGPAQQPGIPGAKKIQKAEENKSLSQGG